jgi:AAA domain
VQPGNLNHGAHEDEGTVVHHFPPKPNGSGAKADEPRGTKILSSAEFVRSFVPPDYLVEGLLQRQFFYSLTGKTGAGKTAIALLFAVLIALGRKIDGREFCRGRVLYLAGENPIDVQMRWVAMSQQLDFDPDTIDVYFSPGVFRISEMERHINEEVKRLGGVSLVVVDTTAAYFEGNDENDNVQAGAYARMQRGLVGLPGGPTILALCHPVKNATDDNLLPRGGGAYLNEVDGNLTVRADGVVVHLHWQGKYRGQDFAPISFQLKSGTHELLKDSKGRQLTTVTALPLSDAGEREIKDAAVTHEDQLLAILSDKGRGASLEELAKLLGWLSNNGKPNKGLVYRTADTLKKQKLVKSARRGGLELTDAGNAELKAESDKMQRS